VVVVVVVVVLLLLLPPASGRGSEEDVGREEGDAWKDTVEGGNEDVALQRLTARRSDLRVCALVCLVSRGRGLLL
jgi:hypothetical protein